MQLTDGKFCDETIQGLAVGRAGSVDPAGLHGLPKAIRLLKYTPGTKKGSAIVC